MLIRARMKLWNAGKKAVRERLKAVKEQLEHEQLRLVWIGLRLMLS